MAKAAQAEAPTKKAAPKAETQEAPAKPERVGMTTREAADKLGVTPVRLRRLLRTDDFSNDGTYTRYDITDEVFEQLKNALAAGAGERKPRGRKKANAEVEDSAEEVAAELNDLESEDEVETLDLEDDSEDEESEDEEDEDE